MAFPSTLSPQATAAFQQLQAGDARSARAVLERESAANPNEPTLRLGVAKACSMLGDHDAAIAALSALLEKDPRNFLALMMRGDEALAVGAKQQAASFYNAAISVAPPPNQQAPHIKAHVERARAAGLKLMADYESYLRRTITEAGFDAAAHRPGAASEAIDILFGQRQIYFQQPEQFYFPGLPQRQFYEASDFDWTRDLAAATDAIRDEAKTVLGLDDSFHPYQRDEGGPRVRDSRLYNNPDWSAAYLIRGGRVNDTIAQHCPNTMAALQSVPLCRIPDKNPAVLFSLLRPRTKIDAHHGLTNSRLIGHLPLIVPDGGCYLRVGNEKRYWREGEVMIFDDSIEHEADNPTDELRIVLLFDIWRPEFSAADRKLVTALYQAIDAYSG